MKRHHHQLGRRIPEWLACVLVTFRFPLVLRYASMGLILQAALAQNPDVEYMPCRMTLDPNKMDVVIPGRPDPDHHCHLTTHAVSAVMQNYCNQQLSRCLKEQESMMVKHQGRRAFSAMLGVYGTMSSSLRHRTSIVISPMDPSTRQGPETVAQSVRKETMNKQVHRGAKRW